MTIIVSYIEATKSNITSAAPIISATLYLVPIRQSTIPIKRNIPNLMKRFVKKVIITRCLLKFIRVFFPIILIHDTCKKIIPCRVLQTLPVLSGFPSLALYDLFELLLILIAHEIEDYSRTDRIQYKQHDT